jgi:hypothetical protein
MKWIMKSGSAWNTQLRWTSTQRKYLYFCGLAGVKQAIPTTAFLLMAFCAWLVRCGHDHLSIRQYVDGVRVLNCDLGHEHPWKLVAYAADRFKKGLKNVAPHIPKDDKMKLPLRGHLVVKLVMDAKLDWLARRFCCVLVLAYSTASRIGHWCPASNTNKPHLLTRGCVDLIMDGGGEVLQACITLPSTKTSPTPIKVWVWRGDDPKVCPVRCLVWLLTPLAPHSQHFGSTSRLELRPKDPLVPHSPHFGSTSRVWNRAAFNKELSDRLVRIGINPLQFSGVSLRKGCLTDLAIMGASPLAVSKHATHKSIQSQMHYVAADEAFMYGNSEKLQTALSCSAKSGLISYDHSTTSHEEFFNNTMAQSPYPAPL